MLTDDLPLDFSKKADDQMTSSPFSRHSPSPTSHSSAPSPATSSPITFGRLADDQITNASTTSATAAHLPGLSALAQLTGQLGSLSSLAPALGLNNLLAAQPNFAALNPISFPGLNMSQLAANNVSAPKSEASATTLSPVAAAAVNSAAAAAAASACNTVAGATPFSRLNGQNLAELLSSMSTLLQNQQRATLTSAAHSPTVNSLLASSANMTTNHHSNQTRPSRTNKQSESDSIGSSTGSSSSLLLSPSHSRSSMCSPTGSVASHDMDTSSNTSADQLSSTLNTITSVPSIAQLTSAINTASTTTTTITNNNNSLPANINLNLSTNSTVSPTSGSTSSSTSSSGAGRKRGKPIPDEQKDDQYWERRRKNNEAAKRSRDAKRAKEGETSLRATVLEQENLQLRLHVAQLREENQMLKSIFNIEHVDPVALQRMALTPQSLSP